MATKARHLKTPLQLWIADQRKAGGYLSSDLAEWTGVTTDTARGWESRGRPSDEAIQVLERKFGKPAPLTEAPSGGDQSALVAAITAQADAITKQAAAIEALGTEIRLAALAVLGGQESTAELLGQLVVAAREGTLDELVSGLRGGNGQ